MQPHGCCTNLSSASLDLHAALTEAGVPTGLERSGVLYLFEEAAQLDRVWRGLPQGMREGARIERLGVSDAMRIEPAIRSSAAGAI